MKQFDMSDNHSSNQYRGMTHYVELPSAGKHYPEGHPLHGIDKVEIKMLTTKEEDILTNTSYIENGVVINKLIEEILLIDLESKDLHDADQMAILIAARIEAYGQHYPIEILCSNCGEYFSHDLDLTDFGFGEMGDIAEQTEVGTYVVFLPKSEKTVEFKHLLPKDVATIEKTVDKMKKLNIKTNFNTEFYRRIILSVDGDANKGVITELIDNLRIMDSRKIFAAYTDSLPSMDTSYKCDCSHCGHANEGGMPVQASFFFPKF